MCIPLPVGEQCTVDPLISQDIPCTNSASLCTNFSICYLSHDCIIVSTFSFLGDCKICFFSFP
uniref:Uncharacterized protein n=1 Tax=Anguilla anguilla TaxID=7936 RepID=A0A0E9X359_ANGAN